MGFLKTLGHLINPWTSPFGPVHRALRGLPYSNIVPVNRYVHLIISMPICIYALSYNRYNYVYVLAAYSIKEGKFCYAFNINLHLRRMHFQRQIQLKKEEQIKV